VGGWVLRVRSKEGRGAWGLRGVMALGTNARMTKGKKSHFRFDRNPSDGTIGISSRAGSIFLRLGKRVST